MRERETEDKEGQTGKTGERKNRVEGNWRENRGEQRGNGGIKQRVQERKEGGRNPKT